MSQTIMRTGNSQRAIVFLAVAIAWAIVPGPPAAASGTPGTIDTFAGGGFGPIALDILSAPTGMAVVKTPITNSLGEVIETEGTVFFSDTRAHRVKKLVPSTEGSYGALSGAKVVNVAGSGIAGYGGEGGEAIKARLSSPVGLAIFGTSLFISDSGNNRIRVVDLVTGVITTALGNGSADELYSPSDIATSGDLLYVADTYHHQVKEFDLSGASPTLVASHEGFELPRGVAAYDGAIYVSDTGGNRVIRLMAGAREVIAGDGSYGFQGDGGPGALARLNTPLGLEADASFLYIADSGNDRIRRVDLADLRISTFAHRFEDLAGKHTLRSPSDVALHPGGELLLSDTLADHTSGSSPLGSGVIRRVEEGGLSVLAGSGLLPGCCADDYLPARLARLKRPGAVSVYSNGATTMTYIADTANNRVVAVDEETGKVVTVAGRECRTNDPRFPGNDGPTQLIRPYKMESSLREPLTGKNYGATVTLDPTSANAHLDQVDPPLQDGPLCPIGDYQPPTYMVATQASLNHPWGIDLDLRTGSLHIADTYNHRIRIVTPEVGGIVDGLGDERITTIAGNGNPPPFAMPPSGSAIQGSRILDGVTATSTTLHFPHAVAVDNFLGTTALLGNIFIADTYNDAIRMVDAESGLIERVAGGIEVSSPAVCCKRPRGVAVGVDGLDPDNRSEAVYVSDSGSREIRQIFGPGEEYKDFSLIRSRRNIGQSRAGSLGVPFTATELTDPAGVSVDDAGCLYVADARRNQTLVMCPPRPLDLPALPEFDNANESRDANCSVEGGGPLGDLWETACDQVGSANDTAAGKLLDVRYESFVQAGTGLSGSAADGTRASSAPLNYPSYVVADFGRILISDTANNQLKEIFLPEYSCGPLDVEDPQSSTESCPRPPSLTPHPPNDGIRGAKSIDSVPLTVNGNNFGATLQQNERGQQTVPYLVPPDPAAGASTCGTFNTTSIKTSKTVWYSWTSSDEQFVEVNTFGSQFDTVLAVFRGPPTKPKMTDLAQIACNDNSGGMQSQIRFKADTGVTYYLQVGGENTYANYSLTLKAPGQPPNNDNFADATPIAIGVTVSATTVNATIESGEWQPASCIRSEETVRTIWYRFSPSTTMTVHVSVSGLSSKIWALYESSGEIGDLQDLGPDFRCGDVGPSNAPTPVQVSQGKTYYLRIGLRGVYSAGIFNLSVAPS